MNTKEISELQAGYEIDALIAEKVMLLRPEWTHREPAGKKFKTEIGDVIVAETAHYSENITATFDVIQQLRAMRFNVRVELHKTYTTVTLWQFDTTEHGPRPTTCRADTVYLAVCRAALLAVMGGV